MLVDYYKIDDLLSDEDKLLRDSLRKFLEENIKPLIKPAWHKQQTLDFRVIARQFGELGILGSFIEEKYNCPGATYTTYGIVCQEVERIDSALRSFVAVNTGLVMYPIWRFGSDEQKAYWLPKLASGQKIGCYGLTEPDIGSDPSSMKTTAKKIGNKWVLNGSKMWITEAEIADVAIIWAKDADDGKVKGFIVEKGTQGFYQKDLQELGSMRAGGVGELAFSDCAIALDNRLPHVEGLKGPFSCLNMARYGISWGAIGASMDCFETALNYSLERKQFGEPIASYQLVQEKLANMITEITKAQLISLRLSELMNKGKATPAQISLAKRNNVRTARFCARTAREILGANGISLDYSPIRHMANIESVYTYEGTDDMHTLIIGRDITGIEAFRK